MFQFHSRNCKERKKTFQCNLIKFEISTKCWYVKIVTVISVIISALRTVNNDIGKLLKEIGMKLPVESQQKIYRLGTGNCCGDPI